MSTSLGPGVTGLLRAVQIARSKVSVAAVLLTVAGWALAQSSQSLSPVFKYYVWGQVRAPGAYTLGSNPDLVELLSAAGGPTQDADVRHLVLVQAITQRQVKIDLKKVLATGRVIPLNPGDVVMVPDSPWYTIREQLSIVTTVVTFATFILATLTWVSR